jgi:ubiquinone/menaquinone biosynthesis C-methylase UbiE
VRAFYEAVWQDRAESGAPWAWARRRALLLAELQPGDRLLDLGCGEGHFVAAARAAGAEVVGVDIAEAALERARVLVPGADLRLVEPDGSLPLAHAAVDVVWCSEVLEHVPDTIALLTEVRRVLRPGGRLLLTVPDHGRLRRLAIALLAHERHYDPLGQHLRFYTRRSLRGALVATGFEAIELGGLSGLPGLHETLVARAVRG